jgi:hypothetical protein
MYLRILEAIFLIGGLWFIITQMIFPAIRGTQVFPIFRKEAKLIGELVEVNQKVREKGLEDTIKETKKQFEPKPEEQPKPAEESKPIEKPKL